MARQKRKLKILPSNFVEENRIHFDSNDELYANEHYGYYLICTDENFNEELISNLSPLGWEHINLTGDYTWVKKVLPLALRI